MSSHTDLPPVPVGRWGGAHLRETRWQLELGRLLVDPVFRGHGVPRGDGRPVILLPGFGGGDQTLIVLAAWLARIGYRPYTCGFVANVGCSDRALERVEHRVERIYEKRGRRVAVIGHSRGGHYARALSHRRPELVSHAVAAGVDLQLSGHTHGGQIWPFNFLVRLDQPVVHGLSRHGERTQLYTSRGSGFWGPPFRVFAPSELTLLTLRNV